MEVNYSSRKPNRERTKADAIPVENQATCNENEAKQNQALVIAVTAVPRPPGDTTRDDPPAVVPPDQKSTENDDILPVPAIDKMSVKYKQINYYIDIELIVLGRIIRKSLQQITFYKDHHKKKIQKITISQKKYSKLMNKNYVLGEVRTHIYSIPWTFCVFSRYLYLICKYIYQIPLLEDYIYLKKFRILNPLLYLRIIIQFNIFLPTQAKVPAFEKGITQKTLKISQSIFFDPYIPIIYTIYYLQLGMSEDNDQNNDKHNNKNNLEKIIKLDKKNGNFDIYDKYAKRKLKIRTSQKNSFHDYTQNEYTLVYFWRHINQIYFKKLDTSEQERLDYLGSLLEDPLKFDHSVKYSDFLAYLSINILNKQQLKQNKLYYQTLLKHIQLSTLMYQSQHIKIPNLDKIYANKQRCMTKFNMKNVSVLSTECANVDKLINKMHEYLGFNDNAILNQLEEYEQELKDLNKQNKKEVKLLMDQCQQIDGQQFLRQQKKLQSNNQALLQYLRKSLQQLDYRQTADSITKVISSVHNGNGYSFVVSFESALNQQFATIDEPLMLELDRLRDSSLFKFYNIPQKTKYSHIAQNFLGIQQVQHNRSKMNSLANKNMFKDVKCTFQLSEGEQLNKFEACHHCKMLFKDDYLITCNYRSGTMGLPIINQNLTDSFIYFDEDLIKSRRQVPNRKKTQYSIYTKKNGELICQRKFCRLCLKTNYDYNFQQQTHDWVCPFCQATCYCSRCHRNDIMIKLRDLYIICGGDAEQLSKDSIFEKYVKNNVDDHHYYNKKKTQQQIQRTGYSMLRQQLNNFKQMQQIRLDFENLRLLTSQVLRREKLKWKIIEQDICLWREDQISKKQQKLKKVKAKKIQISEAHTQTFSRHISSSNDSDSDSSEFIIDSYELEQDQQERNNSQYKLIPQAIKKVQIEPNPFKSFPAKNIKREVQQLLQCQDTETYSLVVKKMREDNKRKT